MRIREVKWGGYGLGRPVESTWRVETGEGRPVDSFLTLERARALAGEEAPLLRCGLGHYEEDEEGEEGAYADGYARGYSDGYEA